MRPPQDTASSELQAALALIEDIKGQQMGAKRQLVELWSLAWDLCDADADGSVTMDECISIDQKLAKSAGRHFDPDVVAAFLELHETFRAIAVAYADTDADLEKKVAYRQMADGVPPADAAPA